MFFIALAFLILGIVVFGAVSAAIIFHIRKYGIQGDRSPLMLRAFIGGALLWTIVALGSFFAVPWNTLVEKLQQ